ncbi:MAG: hypothetical protein AB7O97_02570 [Planctomycetota bacterium]
MRHHRLPFRTVLTAGCLVLATAALPGQGDAAARIRHDATTMILPAGHLPLADVVAATAAFLQFNILFDEREVEASGRAVVLQVPMAIARDRAEEVIADLVYSVGFLLVPRDADKGLYALAAVDGPRLRDLLRLAPWRAPEQILARPNLKQPVNTVFTLRTINANIATNSLRPFFAQAGAAAPGQGFGLTFGTGGNNESLLLSGLQSDVAGAIELLRQIDGVPAAAPGALPAEGAGAIQQRIAALEEAVQQLQKALAALQEQQAGEGGPPR